MHCLEAFNSDQNINDQTHLKFYESKPKNNIARSTLTYDDLIGIADALQDKKITLEELKNAKMSNEPCLGFSFDLFKKWVNDNFNKSNDFAKKSNYIFLPDKEINIPADVLSQIPYENRHSMSFSNYTVSSDLHYSLFNSARNFCAKVMNGESSCIILTGKAGIGKSASAVSAFKELVSRNKNVVWITEVTVKNWTQKAESMEALSASRDEIKKILQENPDAVFMDDNNITGYAGKIILEEIYKWYVTNPGKGLYITSNVPISFKKCYGVQLDGSYHFPLFAGYHSSQYQHTISFANLNGQSKRSAPTDQFATLSSRVKLLALRDYKLAQSVGIIIDSAEFDKYKSEFNDNEIEYIPAIDGDLLDSLRMSLKFCGPFESLWNSLTSNQKKYIEKYPVNNPQKNNSEYLNKTNQINNNGIRVRIFERTEHSVIALELMSMNNFSYSFHLDPNCVGQLISVVNYAHDQGGKKVILINKTMFNHDDLLKLIEKHISASEKERFMARFTVLFNLPKRVEVQSNTTYSYLPFFGGICDISAISDISAPSDLQGIAVSRMD